MRVFSIALFAAGIAIPASAQVVHTTTKQTTTIVSTSGRTGTAAGTVAAIAPPPATVLVVPNQQVFIPRGFSIVGNVPVVTLTDGRVFANFGNGFEQIIRNCSALVTFVNPQVIQPAVVQPVVVQPVVLQPSSTVATQPIPPIPYTQQWPNQATASQEMLAAAGQQALIAQSTVINSTTCFSGNGRGQVFIARP
jgi:hypothetical protein